MDIGTIAGGLSSLKAAGDIAKTIADLRDWQAVQGKVADLTREIISAQAGAIAAQQAVAELQEQVRQLQSEARQRDAWNQEKQRYQLTDYGGGTFAYALKPDAANGDPDHTICPSCYQNGSKSILQTRGTDDFSRKLVNCPSCRQDFALGNKVQPSWRTDILKSSY